MSKRPGEIQRRVHGPEGQREDELEVRDRQVHDEVVDRGFLPPLPDFHEEEDQQVAYQTHRAHHRVHDGDHDAQLQRSVREQVDVLQVAEAAELGAVRGALVLEVRHSVQPQLGVRCPVQPGSVEGLHHLADSRGGGGTLGERVRSARFFQTQR